MRVRLWYREGKAGGWKWVVLSKAPGIRGPVSPSITLLSRWRIFWLLYGFPIKWDSEHWKKKVDALQRLIEPLGISVGAK